MRQEDAHIYIPPLLPKKCRDSRGDDGRRAAARCVFCKVSSVSAGVSAGDIRLSQFSNGSAASKGGTPVPNRRLPKPYTPSEGLAALTRTVLANAYASESRAKAHIAQAVRDGSVAEYRVLVADGGGD